jgi:HAD superfamily hydrolase (TIGR01490 family)
VPQATAAKTAAFFDVDGTLVKSTIVHYYAYFRRRRMSPLAARLWYSAFLVKCVYFLVLDKIDRSRFNVAFYRSYTGLPAAEIKAQVSECYHNVMKPRRFRQVAECVAGHRESGDEIILVTGSIDFIVEPFAKDLAADGLVAPSLLESAGRFNGKLDGPPVGDQEKARRVEQFAEARGIDLSRSHAYGDSIADLPMLELVGYPHVVNPDRALGSVAKSRGWPVHRWTVAARRGKDDR